MCIELHIHSRSFEKVPSLSAKCKRCREMLSVLLSMPYRVFYRNSNNGFARVRN